MAALFRTLAHHSYGITQPVMQLGLGKEKAVNNWARKPIPVYLSSRKRSIHEMFRASWDASKKEIKDR